jgi:DnaJ homolog subfamily B member 12
MLEEIHQIADLFPVVSRAFQILSDPDKKARYDQFGGDPDNRFSSSGGSGAASSPFSGFARSPGPREGFYEDEISPEELFNRFFGGGGLGGGFGGGFGAGGPQFIFNMGGGPGFTVHRMGGATPRRRPQAANGEAAPPPSGLTALTQLLPLLLLFILPLLSSLFSGSSSPSPSVRFDSPIPPNTMHRITPRYKVNYYINPVEVDGYSPRKFHQLDQQAEVDYISTLQYGCELEKNTKQQMLQDAQGWFSVDEEKVKQARSMTMRNCNRLDELRVRRQY